MLVFLGLRTGFIVASLIPSAMIITLFVMQSFEIGIDQMSLASLIIALGMLVDNGIVVVENVYRLMEKEGYSRIEAAKKGIGEIALPIIVSTLTTVAAFIPLGLWPGVMGEFMKYFPITLSIVLGSSLFVAIFFNSFLVSRLMNIEDKILSYKQLTILSIVLIGFGVLILSVGGLYRGLGTIMIFTAILFWLYRLFIKNWTIFFQNRILTFLENAYEKSIKLFLKGPISIITVILMVIMLISVMGLFGSKIENKDIKVEFFPENTPNQIMVYIEYPQGTAIEKTNQITQKIEQRVNTIINDEHYIDTHSEEKNNNILVASAVSQVGEGAGNPFTDSGSNAEMPHKGKVTLTMREFKLRKGRESKELLHRIQKDLKGIYPGVVISVEKDPVGPPAGYPINIEFKGKDYDQLISEAEKMKEFLNSKNIEGVDELKIDVNKSKPAMRVKIDREKAGELGVSAAQIGYQLRRSIFGEKASVYKELGEDYDIYVRFNKENRYNTNALFNQNITFRDPATGQLKEIPISSIASFENTSSFSSIKHRKLNRVVVLYSSLASGFIDASAVIKNVKDALNSIGYQTSKEVTYQFTGQIEEEEKQQKFLMGALLSGLGLIMFILIMQFNSISKPIIIMIAVFLSFIGVFLGIIFTGKSFVIMMTMMGIISLAGIVVNNGVVLLDYAQLLIDRKRVELNLSDNQILGKNHIFESIVKAGKARLRPVLLTAITTVLGLIPLATGININFFSLVTQFDSQLYIGGDNVIFWGPLALTVIYGLLFATFLTLIVVPVIFYLSSRLQLWFKSKNKKVVN